MHDLFLSYARNDDEPFVQRLYERLTREGLDVWFDRQRMPNEGRTFDENIARAVQNSRRLALVVGPKALKSDYVQKEWREALDYRNCVPVIPLMRLSNYAELPDELKNIDGIDFRKDEDFEQRFTYLLRQVSEAPVQPAEVRGIRLQIPQGYIERPELKQKLDQQVRGQALGNNNGSVTALQAMGGLGKTLMAAVYVHDCDVRRSFDNGIYWLTAGRDGSAFGLQVRLAQMMGINTEDFTEQDSTARLQRILADQRVLIVLDDVWDKSLISDGFRPILGKFGRLLFTTRNLRLVTLTEAQRVEVETLSTDEGVRLIGRFLQRPEAQDFEGNPQLESERAIVDILKGHTLAVRLAAAHLREVGADYAPTLLAAYQKARESEQPFGDLDMDPDDKNWSVAASLKISYEALSAESQARFRQLGVLAENANFATELAAHLWEVEQPKRALDELAHAALLDYDPATERYEQHPLLRAYARALLIESKALDDTFNRYADYIIERSKQFDNPPETWRDTIERDIDHVHEVGDALMVRTENGTTGDLYRATIFPYIVNRYVTNRMEVHKWSWLEMGLNAVRKVREDDPEGAAMMRMQSLFLNQLSLVWSALGEQDNALEYCEEALVIDRAVGDRLAEASTLNNMGAVWRVLGKSRKALTAFEQALALVRTVGDRSGEAATLNNIGSALDVLGEKNAALDNYEQALSLYRVLGDRWGEATALTNIGNVWRALRKLRKAMEYYEQALPLRREVGDQSGEATTLNNIGILWLALEEPRKAVDYYDQALSLYRAIGNRSGEATILSNIGLIWHSLGEPQRALKYYEQAIPLRRAVGDRSGEATTLNNIASIYYEEGELKKAVEVFEHIIEIIREIGDVATEASILYNAAIIYQDIGRTSHAIRAATNGREILRRYSLPQAAFGQTVAMYDQLLTRLRRE